MKVSRNDKLLTETVTKMPTTLLPFKISEFPYSPHTNEAEHRKEMNLVQLLHLDVQLQLTEITEITEWQSLKCLQPCYLSKLPNSLTSTHSPHTDEAEHRKETNLKFLYQDF